MRTILLNESLVGNVLENDYLIQEYLGAGGYGAAYKAQQISLGREVCIKFMSLSSLSDADSIKRFKREARVLARLRHKNIVECFSFGLFERVYPFLVMQLAPGRSLREILSERKLDWLEACRIILQVCEGTQHAHDAGFIHRDLKPENIMVETLEGREFVRIIDFGLVGKTDAIAGIDTLTTPGTVMGTPYYMAPEAFSNIDVSTRTDLYAIGCILYECLSGQMPFAAENQVAIMRKHMTQTLPELPTGVAPDSVRETLDSIILTATESDPSKRIGSCREFGDLLADLIGVSSGAGSVNREKLSVRTAADEPSLTSSKKSTVLIAISLVSLLAVAFAIYLFPTRQFTRSRASNSVMQNSDQIVRQMNELNSALQATPSASEAKVKEMLSALESFMHNYASPPAFATDSSLEASQRKLCATFGRFVSSCAKTSSPRVSERLVGDYADLLACCGFYANALNVVKPEFSCASASSMQPVARGNRLDLKNYQEYLASQFDNTKAISQEKFLLRMRPLGPRLTLFDDSLPFRKLIIMRKSVYIKDPWKPSLCEIGLSVNSLGNIPVAHLLCDIAEINHYEPMSNKEETKKLLLKAVDTGPLYENMVPFVASTLYSLGEMQQADKLFAAATSKAARRHQSRSWCLLTATYAEMLAQQLELARSIKLTDEMLRSPQWAETLMLYQKLTKEDNIGTIQAAVKTAEALVAQARLYKSRGDLPSARERMGKAGSILLAGERRCSTVVAGILSYLEFAQNLEDTDPVTCALAQRIIDGSSSCSNKAMRALVSLRYAKTLLGDKKVEQAKSYCALGVALLSKHVEETGFVRPVEGKVQISLTLNSLRKYGLTEECNTVVPLLSKRKSDTALPETNQ